MEKNQTLVNLKSCQTDLQDPAIHKRTSWGFYLPRFEGASDMVKERQSRRKREGKGES